MKIIYYCQTGNYGALAAAGIHLKIINASTTYDDLVNYLNSYEQPAYRPLFIGQDHKGTGVYALGTTSEKQLVHKIIDSFVKTFCQTDEHVLVIDALPNTKFPLTLMIRARPLPVFNNTLDKFMPYLIWQHLHLIEDQISILS